LRYYLFVERMRRVSTGGEKNWRRPGRQGAIPGRRKPGERCQGLKATDVLHIADKLGINTDSRRPIAARDFKGRRDFRNNRSQRRSFHAGKVRRDPSLAHNGQAI